VFTLKRSPTLFGNDIDYTMLQKIYGNTPQGAETGYSPAICMGTKRAVISGTPDFNHVSTSYVERKTSQCACLCGDLPV
jgi:hypothetical protein